MATFTTDTGVCAAALPLGALITNGHTAERPFFGRIESLRGLGALAVAGYHFSGIRLSCAPLLPDVPVKDHGLWQAVLNWTGNFLLPGHAALMIFFVISGFVLRMSLQHGPQQWSPAVQKFFLGRAFRIFPIVIVGVVLTVLALRAEAGPISGPRLIRNMLLLETTINPTYWALQVELMMMPIILGLYFLERKTGPRLLIGLALVTTVLAYCPYWAISPHLSTNLFPFILGMVIPTRGRALVMAMSRRAATWWAAGCMLVLLLTHPCLGLYSRNSAVVEAYAAVVLVSLVAYRRDIAVLAWLETKVLRWLGLSSGSYYVLHMVTRPTALVIATATVPLVWRAHFPVLVQCCVLPLWLCAIVPFTVCTYYLIEKPGIVLGRRVARMWGLV
jgi:peptidoglycan/LPS O-acetylase OafA/YrhL